MARKRKKIDEADYTWEQLKKAGWTEDNTFKTSIILIKKVRYTLYKIYWDTVHKKVVMKVRCGKNGEPRVCY